MECRVATLCDYQSSEGPGEWNSGILNIDLVSWDQFHDVIANLLEHGDFIWRGQRDDWELRSKFDRVVKEKEDRAARLEEHKQIFERAIRGRRGQNPPQLDDDEIWALGQHYGLATPLLDWTESPFVATYFAFREKPNGFTQETTSSRYIYGLSKDLGRWGPSNSPDTEPYDHFIEFVEPLSDENPRLLNQRGLFTNPFFESVDIRRIVQNCYAKDQNAEKKRIIFVEISIPESERIKCLRNLNSMNINHATLFPDLTGAAEYCNVKLEIDDYS